VLAAGTAAVLECELAALYPGGDHWIVTGRVTHLRVQSDAPALQYRNGEYGTFSAQERSS
jgi:flavin reductase (DIM6/NTAB) family NADH-FMN oxidoreductase RutF